jgi:hypothetical protein
VEEVLQAIATTSAAAEEAAMIVDICILSCLRIEIKMMSATEYRKFERCTFSLEDVPCYCLSIVHAVLEAAETSTTPSKVSPVASACR